MTQNKFYLYFNALLVLLVLITLNNCGSDGGAGLNDVNLSSIPSASQMLAGNGTYGLNLQSVQGTAPNLKDLTSTNALTYFWNGVATTIADTDTCTAANRNKFWGQDTSTPGGGGHGACMMAQGTGEALSRLMEGMTTLCYMKSIGSAASGVTATGGTAGDAFKQGTSDKVVKVGVRNMSSRADMDVFFRVHGTDSVGSDKYSYLMWMCRNGSVTSRETLEINKGNGTFTTTMANAEGTDRGTMSISAFLKNDGGTIKFDPTKTRTAISKWNSTWGTYIGRVELTSDDTIKASRYNYHSSWGANKTYSVAAFSGTGANDFKFLQGCFKGQNSPVDLSTTWTYSGITEYRDTFYAAVSSSDLSPQCDAFSFSSDSLFTDLTVPTLDTTGLSCSTTADVDITMDFSDAAIIAIKSTCEDDKRAVSNYSMCESATVREAEQRCRSRR